MFWGKIFEETGSRIYWMRLYLRPSTFGKGHLATMRGRGISDHRGGDVSRGIGVTKV